MRGVGSCITPSLHGRISFSLAFFCYGTWLAHVIFWYFCGKCHIVLLPPGHQRAEGTTRGGGRTAQLSCMHFTSLTGMVVRKKGPVVRCYWYLYHPTATH
jgi:hypothetical protein